MRMSRSFEKRIVRACIPSNLTAGLFIYFYTVSVIRPDPSLWGPALLVVLAIVGVFQICFAPLSNILVARKLSRRLEEWQRQGLSVAERTELLCQVQAFPKKKQKEACLYFAVGTGLLAAGYARFLGVEVMDIVASVSICIFCTHIAGVLNLFSSIKICSEYAEKLVGQGVDPEVIGRKRTLGVNFRQSFVQLMVLPLVFTTVLFVLTFTINYLENDGVMTSVGMLTICTVVVVNIIASVVLTLICFSIILRSSQTLQESMEHITRNDIFAVHPVSTDLANEISYNMYLANNIIVLFQSMLTKIRTVGESLLPSIDDLQNIADETASSSYQQSSGVQEMLATIEETETQIRDIVSKLGKVTAVSETTATRVEASLEALGVFALKMAEISQANGTITSGIWNLGEKINNVWDIVDRINAIADQTKIIGFNAELKASEAGTAAGNFLLIANEIKRLATSITDAVVLIQKRISEIQASSDNLVIFSEGGTERLREGNELSKRLADKIEDIRISADITRESMADIAAVVQQQSSEIRQISHTVSEISTGIELVSSSMAMVTDITDKLKVASYRLENLNKVIIQSEETD